MRLKGEKIKSIIGYLHKVKKFVTSHLLFILVAIGFIIFWVITLHPFSNKELFSIISQDSGNSNISLNKGCIGINTEEPNLIGQLSELIKSEKFFKGNAVEKIFFQNLPSNLDSFSKEDLASKKEIFIKGILPSIIEMNLRVQKQRARLLYFINKIPKDPLTKQDMAEIKSLANDYKVTSNFGSFWDYLQVLNQLLTKVNTIPNSLVLAIAIQETGWGHSRFLKEGNSLFSEWTYNPKEGIPPKRREPGKAHFVKKYKTILDAVNSFFYNLNSSDYYRNFRNTRVKDLNKKGKINPFALADTLDLYSAQGNQYGVALKQIMNRENLTKYDKYTNFIPKSSQCIFFY